MKNEENFIKNPLLDKKVTIYPVERPGGWPQKGTDGADGFFSGAFHEFLGVPYSSSLRKHIDPLTEDEKKFFYSEDSELDIQPGHLSVHKKDGFWTTFNVKLTKEAYELSLLDPMDYLRWKFMLAQKDIIAPSWTERKAKATYKFVIRDHDIENDITVKKIAKEKEVNRHFYKIENNPTQLSALIKMYYFMSNSTKKLPPNPALALLSTELYNIIEKDLNRIYDIIVDKNFDIKLLIYESLNAGIIDKPSKFEYQIVGREELLNMTDLVAFLSSKRNNTVLIELKAKLENI